MLYVSIRGDRNEFPPIWREGDSHHWGRMPGLGYKLRPLPACFCILFGFLFHFIDGQKTYATSLLVQACFLFVVDPVISGGTFLKKVKQQTGGACDRLLARFGCLLHVLL